MDGVLVDSHAVHRTAWRQFFQTLGQEVSEPELDFILDGRKRSDILRHFLGNCSDPELEELGRRKDQYLSGNAAGGVPGSRCCAAWCASCIAMAPRWLSPPAPAASERVSTLTELGLIDCFPVIVAGEDVLLGKPDAAIYRLGLHPHRDRTCELAGSRRCHLRRPLRRRRRTAMHRSCVA